MRCRQFEQARATMIRFSLLLLAIVLSVQGCYPPLTAVGESLTVKSLTYARRSGREQQPGTSRLLLLLPFWQARQHAEPHWASLPDHKVICCCPRCAAMRWSRAPLLFPFWSVGARSSLTAECEPPLAFFLPSSCCVQLSPLPCSSRGGRKTATAAGKIISCERQPGRSDG